MNLLLSLVAGSSAASADGIYDNIGDSVTPNGYYEGDGLVTFHITRHFITGMFYHEQKNNAADFYLYYKLGVKINSAMLKKIGVKRHNNNIQKSPTIVFYLV